MPADVEVVELVDFEHVARYLDNVIDACDPADTHDMKSWYRSVLLDDASGIDRIQHNLRRQGQRLPVDDDSAAARKAIAAALSYMRPRKDKMRYASHYRQNLPIGSGATESTCWQMQQRVKLPGAVLGAHGTVRRPRHPRARPLRALGFGVASLRGVPSRGGQHFAMIRIASTLHMVYPRGRVDRVMVAPEGRMIVARRRSHGAGAFAHETGNVTL